MLAERDATSPSSNARAEAFRDVLDMLHEVAVERYGGHPSGNKQKLSGQTVKKTIYARVGEMMQEAKAQR